MHKVAAKSSTQNLAGGKQQMAVMHSPRDFVQSRQEDRAMTPRMTARIGNPILRQQMRDLSLLLADAAAALPPADARAASSRLQRMHFATLPVPAMRNWLPALLRQWRSPRHMLIASSGGSGVRVLPSQPRRVMKPIAGSSACGMWGTVMGCMYRFLRTCHEHAAAPQRLSTVRWQAGIVLSSCTCCRGADRGTSRPGALRWG